MSATRTENVDVASPDPALMVRKLARDQRSGTWRNEKSKERSGDGKTSSPSMRMWRVISLSCVDIVSFSYVDVGRVTIHYHLD